MSYCNEAMDSIYLNYTFLMRFGMIGNINLPQEISKMFCYPIMRVKKHLK